jgi:hypothetical protein
VLYVPTLSGTSNHQLKQTPSDFEDGEDGRSYGTLCYIELIDKSAALRTLTRKSPKEAKEASELLLEVSNGLWEIYRAWKSTVDDAQNGRSRNDVAQKRSRLKSYLEEYLE